MSGCAVSQKGQWFVLDTYLKYSFTRNMFMFKNMTTEKAFNFLETDF